MLRLRPYKSCDSKHIADWIKNEETFVKWGGERFGSYPINAKIIDDKYRLNNGDCVEEDNFYPMTAFDDSGVVGHFIMRYINGNNKILRFGWVIVDDTQRGKGYGKQMLELGLKYAFEISGVEKVTIGVFENNIPAYKCYKSIGFNEIATDCSEFCNPVEFSLQTVRRFFLDYVFNGCKSADCVTVHGNDNIGIFAVKNFVYYVFHLIAEIISEYIRSAV